jgi:hypothetical protein
VDLTIGETEKCFVLVFLGGSGVVSLLAMLEFAAQEYVQLAHEFGLLIATLEKRQLDTATLGRALDRILTDARTLGLPVTRDQVGRMMLEFVTVNPDKASLTQDGYLRIEGQSINTERLCHHIESVYSILKSELSSIPIRAISREKTKYIDPQWLTDSRIYIAFPSAWQEFQRAGHCYAYGENTACAFHLQRALEWGLKSLAVDLGKKFDRNSWGKHLEDIETALEVKYKSAGPRTKEEKFYSEAATQFGNMKVAWRNPTMHIEAKYDEGEAAYLLTTTEKFMTYLAENNLREAGSPANAQN